MRSRWRFRGAARTVRALVAAGAAVLVVLMGVTLPAAAAGNDMSVAIRPLDTRVKSGENISFEVQWECGSTNSPTCANGQIVVPVPDGQPDGVSLSVESFTAVTIGGTSYPVSVQGTGANRKIVWSLPPTMTGSNAGTVTFMLKSQNWVTPDGTTVTPSAAFTSSLGTASAVSAPATITAELGLKIRKTKYSPTEDPYVDGDVTYLIESGYPSQFPASGSHLYYGNDSFCKAPGLWAMKNLVIVDQLPPGTVFKSSTMGGVYNAQNHTVTWNLGDSAKVDANGVASCDATTFAKDLLVTVNYPASTFTNAANQHLLQTNTVSATAQPWLRPGTTLSDSAKAEHYLRIGTDGTFTVQKGTSYAASNGPSWQWARGEKATQGDWVRGYLHSFSVTGTGNAVGSWSMTDVLPCGWTSPSDPSTTNCATPAYRDISFGANGAMSELKVHWITNQGRTGVCTIPEGFTAGDSTVRFCDGISKGSAIPMGAGEWITKFWLDRNPMKGGTKGKLLLFGTVSRDIPIDNSTAVAAGTYQPHFLTTGTAQPTPVRGVTPSSEHPLWATVENCTADNTITWNGGSMTTNGSKVDSNQEGRCGYTRIARDPVNVYSEKRVYNPSTATTVAQKQAQSSSQPGDRLRVEVQTQRSSWGGGDDATMRAARFTPTITDVLPENLVYDPKDPANPVYLGLEGNPGRPASAVIAKLGAPRLTVSDVVIGGKTRTKIVIDFPNAADGSGLFIWDPVTGQEEKLTVGFDVRVKEGTPAATSQNYSLVQAKEAATGYLTCTYPGAYADPQLPDPVKSWADLSFGNAVQGPAADTGCRVQKPYTVVEGPGMGSQKQVKGAYDPDYVPSPGIGSTDRAGAASYRIPVTNTGNVDMRDVVVYDLLPRTGDHGVRPGADVRGSAFDVFMTGPAAGLPAGATVLYSTAANPCRGELAGAGGGPRSSAPAGCDDTWVAAAAIGADWAKVTGIRIDFGPLVWKPLDTYTATFPARAGNGGDLTGIAWNNVAIAGNRNSSGIPMLPNEAPKVGLQLAPDLAWNKVDGLDSSTLLAGSEWTLTPVVVAGAPAPAGTWPKTVVDCAQAPCTGADQDPAPGKFRIVGVPWGSYDLRETKAPAGYVLPADPVRVVVGPGGLDPAGWTYRIGDVKNVKPGVDVSWEKVDPQHQRLAGAEWDLVPVDGNGAPTPGGTVVHVTDCAQQNAAGCLGADTDPAPGRFLLRQVPAGDYHLIETRAPAGFAKLTAPVRVTVSGATAVAIGQIENRQVDVPVLPLTGGIGTLVFSIGGGLLIAVTAFLVIRTTRRRRLAVD
ncbi:SpaA isopeptide-forming pilin-related protein [Leucobacter sp. HNU]|uniref:SpaA isopeptide-forming pilin-related protein n=1 Tax=Leucobacter sp. HNU TaxID=3236805 RepID=UPI003A805D1A